MESRRHPTVAVVSGFALVGALAAAVLGLLTFGVQATVHPRDLPLAVGTVDASTSSALAPVVERVRGQGGGQVAWTAVGSRAEAERLLDGKAVYGAVLFEPAATGLRALVLTSGAINPSAAQVAQPILTAAAEAVTSASRAEAAARSGTPAGSGTADTRPAVESITMHPATPAGRTLPLAASALLWLATLATGALVLVAGPRVLGGHAGRGPRLAAVLGSAALGTAVVLGLARLWDGTLRLDWSVAGFLLLVATAFGLLQAGVLRWLGLRGMALLAPLYLMAPSVAGQVPELLDPAYKALLWSWTPFRFSAEALRSLLYLDAGAADVRTALRVFAGISIAGLLLLAIPRRFTSEGRHRRPAPRRGAEPTPAPEAVTA